MNNPTSREALSAIQMANVEVLKDQVQQQARELIAIRAALGLQHDPQESLVEAIEQLRAGREP